MGSRAAKRRGAVGRARSRAIEIVDLVARNSRSDGEFKIPVCAGATGAQVGLAEPDGGRAGDRVREIFVRERKAREIGCAQVRQRQGGKRQQRGETGSKR